MQLADLSLTLALYVLGLVHGLDTDHVIDVTDFVSQDPRPSQALRFGSKFGIGHTLTVLAAGLFTYAMKTALPRHFEQSFTVFSGILLMLLGIWGINRRIVRPVRLRHRLTTAYNWAFSTPLRKIYYNLSVTGLSVMAALFIGIIELVQILTPKLGLKGGIWEWIQNLDFGGIGYLLVGLFVLVWGVSYFLWKSLRFENV